VRFLKVFSFVFPGFAGATPLGFFGFSGRAETDHPVFRSPGAKSVIPGPPGRCHFGARLFCWSVQGLSASHFFHRGVLDSGTVFQDPMRVFSPSILDRSTFVLAYGTFFSWLYSFCSIRQLSSEVPAVR